MGKVNFDTLDTKRKKKKDIFIVFLILGIVAFIGISVGITFMDLEKEKTFDKRVVVTKEPKIDINQEQEIKETWAISVENKVENNAKKAEKDAKELKEKMTDEFKSLKEALIEANANSNKKMIEMQKNFNEKLLELKETYNEKLEEQSNKLEDISLIKNTSLDVDNNDKTSSDIFLGEDFLPPLQDKSSKDDNKNILEKIEKIEKPAEIVETLPKLEPETIIEKVEKPVVQNEAILPELSNIPQIPTRTPVVDKIIEPVKPKRKKIQLLDINTSYNEAEIEEDEKLMARYEKRLLRKRSSYHLMTGLTQAYMITGAYAPAFSTGKTEPLPVLLQAEGNILIANDDSQTFDKCLLIGSAKGNMNSQTADIRLVSISCSLADGTKMIEGSISGWVIGENGIPGVPGELMHKNGAWLAKTFVSGFLETFAGAFSTTNGSTINIGGESTTSNSKAIEDNLAGAATGGLSTVFGQLGEYYLEMAQQIFPVIEVKGGRTIDILLKGGENFSVRDFNKLDLGLVSENIKEEEEFLEEIGEEKAEELKIKINKKQRKNKGNKK
jgi:conjugal transfer pilus assembly protein TraB